MITPTAVVLAVVLLLLRAWVRSRLAAAERQRVELEVFRAQLGVPAGRFRVVDVGLAESLVRVARPRLPRFEDAHRVHPRPVGARGEVGRVGVA